MNDVESSRQRKLLECLVVGNAELEQLEQELRRFNLFVALDAVRQEVRHSNFLAYLLNPRGNHGLGSLFLKRFLQAAMADHPLPRFSPLDIEIWPADATVVLREWQNIDITLRDDANKTVVIIENKIDSGEHSNQLRRYLEVCNREFNGWRLAGIYLTPEGEESSEPLHYAAASYGKVCDVLKQLATSGYAMTDEVRIGLRHYEEMLRRYVVTESEISELCRRIYQQHHEALDLIFEHRPDRQSETHQLLERLINENSALELDTSTKSAVRFWVKKLDAPMLRQGEKWTASRRILLFELDNRPRELKVCLYIGPGALELRRRLYEMAKDNAPLRPLDSFRAKWNCIFLRVLVAPASYEKEAEEFEQTVKMQWEQFLMNDLPAIVNIVESQKWIFATTPEAAQQPASDPQRVADCAVNNSSGTLTE